MKVGAPAAFKTPSREEMEAGSSQRCSDQMRVNTSGQKKFCFKLRSIHVLLLGFSQSIISKMLEQVAQRLYNFHH